MMTELRFIRFYGQAVLRTSALPIPAIPAIPAITITTPTTKQQIHFLY